MKNTPNHIAIIPDGNRRWAKKKGLAAWKGHLEGAKTAEKMIKAAEKLGIKYLTLWGSSYDNLTKRSPVELKVLDRVYGDGAENMLHSQDISRNGIKVSFLGEWSKFLSSKTSTSIKRVEAATRNNAKLNLTVLLGYNGDREMLSAINNLAGKATEESIKNALWTKDLPPVDMVIRTGGNPHLSAGFMMWDIKYSFLYFSDKMWPEFKAKDLDSAIEYYSSQDRRKGT
ncbi:MAG: di-trans,poly-cis-decaprenylcistransferase [Candidatus Colwellbacteria bacterium RIFCSPLOWO2_01_FULL_48_10]|uniref:Isoprenyl transferase n=1 Tax=Candidatus Colwellbacteria bacterium RIFCSPLOWO2_01_FULL_48_10 TaxID=1797690 RepID=A0A1G1Z6Z6_9BACT|nr:MAG: di-trans,poly-cis-decaprenylcistransferase [Candidatus Colwellbacteria bacterium RIFCSPLOWO2_01_FULL_48_10]